MFYLTGGGDTEYYRRLDQDLLKQAEKGSRLLLLPIAADPEDYDDAKERVEEQFLGNAITEVDMLTNVEDLTADACQEYQYVYIDGGNTFALAQAVMRSNFFSAMQTFSDQGGIIVADSAGAILLGEDIRTAFIGEDGDDNSVALQSYRGMGLIKNLSVHCHFQRDELEEIQDKVYETGFPILCLAEETGMSINKQGQFMVRGEAPLVIVHFQGKTECPVDTEGNLVDVLG